MVMVVKLLNDRVKKKKKNINVMTSSTEWTNHMKDSFKNMHYSTERLTLDYTQRNSCINIRGYGKARKLSPSKNIYGTC